MRDEHRYEVLLRVLQKSAGKTGLEIRPEDIGLPSSREGYFIARKEIRKRMTGAAVPNQQSELDIICGLPRNMPSCINPAKRRDSASITVSEVLELVTSDYDDMFPYTILETADSCEAQEAQYICYWLLRELLWKSNEKTAIALNKHRNVVSKGYCILKKRLATEIDLRARVADYSKTLLYP